jgi:hypothetical protein
MIPIVAGLLMGAAMGGGIAALQKKDILQGALMGAAGGALGGAFMPAAGGIAGATQGAVTEGATSALTNAASQTTAQGLPALGTEFGVQGAMAGGAPLPGASTGLFGGSGGIGNFLSQNKYALAGGAVGGMMAPGEKPPSPEQGNIYTTQFSQDKNPNFGARGESYFTNQAYAPGTITPVEDYKPTQFAANGGIIALAEGGGLETQRYSQPVRQVAPEVAAYNQQMMARANQQYNVNPRPGPMQVSGFDAPVQTPAAPVAEAAKPKDYIDEYYQQMLGRNADPTGRGLIETAIKNDRGYDPARDIADVIRKSEEFKQSGKNPNPTGIEIGKVYSAGAPAAANSPSGLRFNPRTQQYEGTFAAPVDSTRQSRFGGLGGDSGGDVGANSMDGPAQGNPGGDPGSDASANGGRITQRYNMGGISSLGSYSDGGQLLRGPGDGVSDDIPARIGARQPARLADGEFVVPARVVSELGNGSTDAGAKQLYAMMDRVQKNRKKTVGRGKVAVDAKSRKLLPA